MALLTAREYLELKAQGINPFQNSLDKLPKEKSAEEIEDEYFEKLGELVEQHPIGKYTRG